MPAKPNRSPQIVAEPGSTVRLIPLAQVSADPGQPRKVFDRQGLSDLAASIRADGLLQPITVRETDTGAYMIVAGERRYRASVINGAETIRAIVIVPLDTADVRVKQIIENDQRVDVTPLEQARSYQALMDESGWDAEQLAKRIGKPVHRITDRTILLRLSAEYQALLESGNLKASEAWELARLSPRGQDLLFRAIKGGKCKSHADLRAMASGLAQAEAQISLLVDAPMPVSDDERRLGTAFENMVQRVAALLRSGMCENQVVAIRKVNPHRAGQIADLMGAMQADMRRIELSLRTAAAQADFLAASSQGAVH